MWKHIFRPGLLGFLTLMAWTFVTNGVFGFNSRVRMKQIPDERVVHQILKETVTEPGAYTVNPEPVPGAGFPAGEPVFQVAYSGFGHEAAGRLVFTDTALGVIASLLVAGLLSMTSDRVRSRFALKVLFVAGIGLFAAVAGELSRYAIGGYPAASALLLAGNALVMWTLAGLVMARTMPGPAGPDVA